MKMDPVDYIDADEGRDFPRLPEPERCVRCDDGLTFRDSTTRDAMGMWHTACRNLSAEEHEIAMQDADDLAASMPAPVIDYREFAVDLIRKEAARVARQKTEEVA